MSSDAFTELYPIATVAGRRVAAQFAGVVTVDDMTQEAMLWLLEHPRRVEHARLDDGSLFANRLVAEVIHARLGPVARRERREALGDASQDQYTYSARVVEVLLPLVLDTPAPKAGSVHEAAGRSGARGEGGSLEVMVMDVRRALDQLRRDDRELVLARAAGRRWASFDGQDGLSGEWHRLRYWAVLRQVVEFLNGGVFLDLDPDVEAEALEAVLDDAPLSPATVGDPAEDEWRTIGRDPYREPDY